MVVLRSGNEIEGLRLAGGLVARVFEMLRPRVRPGARLDEIDRAVEDFLRAHGAKSPYKGYRPTPSVPPFPGTVCASVNEQVVHGIPSRRGLREGDVVGIDVGAELGGWIGDACYTYPVGEVSPAAVRLLKVTRECLDAGVAEVRPGARLGDVGAAIQELAEHHGYGVVRELGGHGVGRKLHEEPHVEHFGRRGRGLRLRDGIHDRADDQRGIAGDPRPEGRLDDSDRGRKTLRPVRAHHRRDGRRVRDPDPLAPARRRGCGIGLKGLRRRSTGPPPRGGRGGFCTRVGRRL